MSDDGVGDFEFGGSERAGRRQGENDEEPRKTMEEDEDDCGWME